MTADTASSIGIFLLRFSFGSLMMVHGIQKLMAFNELSATFPDPLGMGSTLSLISAIGAELGCSLLLMAGLATRIALLPLAFTMIIALFVIHADDPWKSKELAATYLCVYLSLLFIGPGRYSLDQLLAARARK